MTKYVYNWAEVEVQVFQPAPIGPDGQPQAPEVPGVRMVVSVDGAGAFRGRAYMCGDGALATGVQPGDMILKNVKTGAYRAMDPETFKTMYSVVAETAGATKKATVAASDVVQ